MVISFLGGEAVKIQFGDTTIAYNPVSKHSKLKTASFGADIVLVSINHEDMNGAETATRGDKAPFVISGPGEYEVGGIFVKGYPSKSKYGGGKEGTESLNTIYTMELEGMNLCFLGAMSAGDLPHDLVEDLESVDVLFVPIGGEDVLGPAEAYKTAVKIEPKIIIPIHYGSLGAAGALKAFLKEGGEEDVKAEDKLTLKKKDLEGRNGDIVVLSPTNS